MNSYSQSIKRTLRLASLAILVSFICSSELYAMQGDEQNVNRPVVQPNQPVPEANREEEIDDDLYAYNQCMNANTNTYEQNLLLKALLENLDNEMH